MKKKDSVLIDLSDNDNHGYCYPNNNSDWVPPGKDGIKRKRPANGLCERMFSDGPKVRPCTNPIYYQCINNGLYFCKQCAHHLVKLNYKRIGRLINFNKV